jgi:hypothetical protein
MADRGQRPEARAVPEPDTIGFPRVIDHPQAPAAARPGRVRPGMSLPSRRAMVEQAMIVSGTARTGPG